MTDIAKCGTYKVKFTVSLQRYPGLTVTSTPFTVKVRFPCEKLGFTLVANYFSDQNYQIEDPAIQFSWVNSQVALVQAAPCGELAITKFYTKSVTSIVDLDLNLFKVDIAARTFAIIS